MDTSAVMFLDCPAYLDATGASRCGLPAEVEQRYAVTSTDGPLESVRIRCPRGHWFNGPVESMTWDKMPQAAARLGGLLAEHAGFEPCWDGPVRFRRR
jgi:hypothetical protein